jgi:UDP-N-acetylglucosamine transferase subunit ALG13
VIFVTVGTQLPFDRLVRAVDQWAAAGNAGAASFAQIGDGGYQPRHLEWTRYLPEAAFRAKVAAARLIVSHAGIGNLMLALECRKPIVVMPRRFALNEHRNDHQVATAQRLGQLPGVTVVEDADALGQALSAGDWRIPPPLRPAASPELLAAVRDFIAGR